MKNYDLVQHVQGLSHFVDDLPIPRGTLYGAVFSSPAANGKIIKLITDEARTSKGVVSVISSADIPGQNQIGAIIQDEKLLTDDMLDFIGQPILLLLADNSYNAHAALNKIKIEYEEYEPVTSAREAFNKGSLIFPPQIFSLGDVESAFKKCDLVVEGTVDSGAQEHLYLETQGSAAVPSEGGGFKIFSATQAPTTVQRAVSKILNLPMNKIEVDVIRIGGGFGGKEDQATAWACLAALGSFITNKPVKLVLSRSEDIRMTGKRNPYSSDYKIGLDKTGKIIAYEVTFYQNAGAAADLSPAILDRTLFHCTNSYFIPNVKATAYSCRTNLPPNTAFRGFGGPQGMFVIESAIYKAAKKLKVDPYILQQKNLIKDGDEFPYGQIARNCTAVQAWDQAVDKYRLEEEIKEIKKYNSGNKFSKKGLSLMPVCFGISFTNTMLNQANALVHIYTDGSISISSAAVEMGQGVNMKLRQVAARIFSVSIDKIKIESTNTTRNSNTSATAASSAADLNGKAIAIACNNILSRLIKTASDMLTASPENAVTIENENVFLDGSKTDLTWQKLVNECYQKRISLSSQAHYATPGIFFDKTKTKGEPFAYHVYGTAILIVTLDCLRGLYTIDSVKVVHDFGKSINEAIDRSQAEGAIMQGIGWMTIEEVVHSASGKLLSDSLSTYKVPDIYYTPGEIEIDFLENHYESAAIFNSKAVGEPPLMYGIGIYFAIANAVKAFNKNAHIDFSAPFTPEKVLFALYSSTSKNKHST